MPSISERSTKAEILAAYHALLEQQQSGPTWPQIWAKLATTSRTIALESRLAARDAYNAGTIVQQWISAVVADLSRPVLRSEA